jgi:hypothetical protein
MNAAETIDQPFRLVDGKGGWLEVRRVTFISGGLPVLSTGGLGFAVDPMEIPAITAKLYEAAGHQPPVMLGRPDLDAMRSSDGGIRFGDLLLCKTALGEVAFAVHPAGKTVTTFAVLEAAQARLAAAATVALADEPPELDPEEVDKLACLVMETLNPGAMGIAGARPLARKILLAGWKREAGHG